MVGENNISWHVIIWNSDFSVHNKVLLECSHTHYLCTVCDCFCTTVGKLSSCYRNCLFGLLSLYHYIFLCFLLPIYTHCVKKKVHFEWFSFKAHWRGFDMDYHTKLYGTRLFIMQWYYNCAKNIHYMLTKDSSQYSQLTGKQQSGELEILK